MLTSGSVSPERRRIARCSLRSIMQHPPRLDLRSPVLIGVAAMLLIGVLISLVTLRDDPPSAPAEQPVAPVAAVVEGSMSEASLEAFTLDGSSIGPALDGFDRSAADGLTTTAQGLTWTLVGGRWGAGGGEAAVIAPDAAGSDALALVDLGQPIGVVAARSGSQVRAGSGIVFWFEDPANYWALVPNPSAATWQLQQYVNSGRVRNEDVGLVGAKVDTLVGVVLEHHQVSVWVAGARRLQVAQVPPAGATGAGLVGFGADPSGRWDALWVRAVTRP